MRAVAIIYLAGLIDGEGCISPQMHSIGSFTISLSITNTNRAVLAWAQKHIGGALYRHQDRRKRRWKTSHILRLNQADLRRLLPRIIPHLRIKKKQALLAVKFLALGYGERPKKWKIVERLHILNKRGS